MDLQKRVVRIGKREMRGEEEEHSGFFVEIGSDKQHLQVRLDLGKGKILLKRGWDEGYTGALKKSREGLGEKMCSKRNRVITTGQPARVANGIMELAATISQGRPKPG